MKELVCNYAVIRFLPYQEVGEFVNIGIVLHCPETGFFDFRLAEARNRRVRGFFPELDREVYRAALKAIDRELARHRNGRELFTQADALDDGAISRGLTEFRALLRRRETLVHFAEPGMILAEPREAIAQLFDRFVNRQFAKSNQYQEQVMRIRLASLLKEWNLRAKYRTNERVGNEMYHFTLPFVHLSENRPFKAIKPLDLDRNEPTEVFEHGGAWVQRLRRLQEHGTLPPHLIFPVRLPVASKPAAAANEVCSELRELSVQIVPFDEPERIRELALV
jgi:hypothetical protein